MLKYFCIYKPYRVLCQFSPEAGKRTLKDCFELPPDIYPVGRLDYDSEGLLLLTNDKKINHLLLLPAHAHKREYWVQVDGDITDQALTQLSTGVNITINGNVFHTAPAIVRRLQSIPDVPDRNPPVRFRKEIPTSWISLELTEGKNRQVRKMTAAVGYPTLRLIRYRIENVSIDNMQPGEIREFSNAEFRHLLQIPAAR